MIERAPGAFRLDELVAPSSDTSIVSRRLSKAVQKVRPRRTVTVASPSRTATPVLKAVLPAIRYAIVQHTGYVETSDEDEPPATPYDLYLYEQIKLDDLSIVLPNVERCRPRMQGIRDIVVEQGGSLAMVEAPIRPGRRQYQAPVIKDLLCIRIPVTATATDQQVADELKQRVLDTMPCYLWLLKGWTGYMSVTRRHDCTVRVKGSCTHLLWLMALVSPTRGLELPATQPFWGSITVRFTIPRISDRLGRYRNPTDARRSRSLLDYRRSSVRAIASTVSPAKPKRRRFRAEQLQQHDRK